MRRRPTSVGLGRPGSLFGPSLGRPEGLKAWVRLGWFSKWRSRKEEAVPDLDRPTVPAPIGRRGSTLARIGLVIDDSGSTAGTDPNGWRYGAALRGRPAGRQPARRRSRWRTPPGRGCGRPLQRPAHAVVAADVDRHPRRSSRRSWLAACRRRWRYQRRPCHRLRSGPGWPPGCRRGGHRPAVHGRRERRVG